LQSQAEHLAPPHAATAQAAPSSARLALPIAAFGSGERERALPCCAAQTKGALIVEISIAGPDDKNGIREVQYKSWLENTRNEDSVHGVSSTDMTRSSYFCDKPLPKEDEKLESDVKSSRKQSLPDSATFVAKLNKKVIGFCTVVRGSEQNSLSEIYIIPAFQGKKIGRRLWDSARQFIDRNNDTTVALLRFNTPAKKFYEGLGFAETGISWEGENLKNGNDATVIEMILRA
jgi:ribosomal protein S18 acetylase RimI-like enzyme